FSLGAFSPSATPLHSVSEQFCSPTTSGNLVAGIRAFALNSTATSTGREVKPPGGVVFSPGHGRSRPGRVGYPLGSLGSQRVRAAFPLGHFTNAPRRSDSPPEP